MYLTEILGRCSDIEARMARIYRLLAQRFQEDHDSAKLWRELALEEETHADILRRELRSFEEQGEDGDFLPEYAARLDHAAEILKGIEARAVGLKTIDDAMALAVAMEQTELEDLYDDLVDQGQPAFRLISEHLEAALTAQPATSVPGIPRKGKAASVPR